MSDAFPWREFAHDPRDPAHARLRAADADRDVVRRVLGDAYAEGRLDREEFDERADVVTGSRTLGELPALIEDLVPVTTASSTTQSVHERAVVRYERARRDALWRAFAVSTLCWVIWAVTSFDGGDFDASFPWPVFVMLATGFHAGRIVYARRDIIASETRRLEKKDRKELEHREERELERRERDRALGHGEGHGDLHGRHHPDPRSED
jgi:hypothetical protein